MENLFDKFKFTGSAKQVLPVKREHPTAWNQPRTPSKQRKIASSSAAEKQNNKVASAEMLSGNPYCSRVSHDLLKVLGRLPPSFVAPAPGRWRERYAGVCEDCQGGRIHPCVSHPERKLRLLFIGHNPSEHAWKSGNYYSNPTNRMWKLLREAEIVPLDWTVDDNPRMPVELRIGFTDLGTEPGNDAGAYKRAVMKTWRADLYSRLVGHLRRVEAWNMFQADVPALQTLQEDFSEADQSGNMHVDQPLDAYEPLVVAFTGKRQYCQLFDPPLKKVAAGLQPLETLPPTWPLKTSQVWVLPSSSGRAVIPWDELSNLYKDLGKAIKPSKLKNEV